jgi:signal transduction histidine kinase
VHHDSAAAADHDNGIHPAARRVAATPFHRRLHVRIGAVVLAVLVLQALGLLLLSRMQQERVNLEVTQRLNRGLARYVLEHQARPLLDAAGRPDRPLLMDMAMYVTRANPAVEVYLLDPAGRITGHAFDAAGTDVAQGSIDLAPVQRLLEGGEHLELPVLGDDPRVPGGRNIFSVAPIGRELAAPAGYLYIVLRGQASVGLAQGSARSSVMRETVGAVLLAAGTAGFALLAALQVLTRPLRRLTTEAQAFREAEPQQQQQKLPPNAARADEIGLLESTMATMRTRIAEQFERAEQNDRVRRELVSNLSHDLQTPLTSIQGYAEHCLLKNDAMQPREREQALQVILRHCASLARRIGDLFELSKLEAGRVHPALEVFCLAELLQDIVEGYRLDAAGRGVSLGLSAASRSGDCVRADIALIARVLQNLIDNALRHTPAGGTVTIGVERSAGHLRVVVADSGAGIAAHHLEHVFERYYQAEGTAPAGAAPSAGLGLAIVKRILDLHGSAIRVRSELGRGTSFEFKLPREAAG